MILLNAHILLTISFAALFLLSYLFDLTILLFLPTLISMNEGLTVLLSIILIILIILHILIQLCLSNLEITLSFFTAFQLIFLVFLLIYYLFILSSHFLQS